MREYGEILKASMEGGGTGDHDKYWVLEGPVSHHNRLVPRSSAY